MTAQMNGEGKFDKARALVFDPEFDKRPQKEQIDYLKRLASSQNHALDLMQKERNDLRDKLTVALAQNANAQQAFDTQKMIVQELVTQSNAADQGTAQRIHELEARVKALDAVVKSLNGES